MSSRVLVLQYDNRIPFPFPDLRNRNVNYSNYHNYTYICETEKAAISPYWVKVELTLRYLKDGQFDYILWLDSDACVYDFNVYIESFFDNTKEFAFSRDHPSWSMLFNAGVYIVKRSNTTIRLFETWMSLYPSHRWSQGEEGEWICAECDWAGSQYEQGSFVDSLLNDPSFTSIFQREHPDVLQKTLPPCVETFVMHFAANFKQQIPEFIDKHGLCPQQKNYVECVIC